MSIPDPGRASKVVDHVIAPQSVTELFPTLTTEGQRAALAEVLFQSLRNTEHEKQRLARDVEMLNRQFGAALSKIDELNAVLADVTAQRDNILPDLVRASEQNLALARQLVTYGEELEAMSAEVDAARELQCRVDELTAEVAELRGVR